VSLYGDHSRSRTWLNCPQADVLPQCVKGAGHIPSCFFAIPVSPFFAEFDKRRGILTTPLNELASNPRAVDESSDS